MALRNTRTSGTRGRRKLLFQGSLKRSQRRKSKQLRTKTVGFPETIPATNTIQRCAGKTDVAKLFGGA
jgi:hypothetical protein